MMSGFFSRKWLSLHPLTVQRAPQEIAMRLDKTKTFKLSTFFCLYLAQAVPMSFFTTALQVIMREQQFSLSAIALLQLVKLPWILKMLWSPMIDRACTTTRGYKRLIVGSEVVYALLILLAGVLNLQINVGTIVVLVLLSLVASATQDIGTDALAILSSQKREKALLNSMQSMGSFGGSLVGSGLLLMVLHRYGWNMVTQCLSVFVLVAVVPLLLNKNIQLQKPKDARQRARWSDFVWFFTQRGIWRQIVFLALYYMGIIGIMSTLKPYMVDLGYSMREIGVMNGVVGVASAFVVSYPAGMLVRRFGYGRTRVFFAIVMLVATSFFVVLSLGRPSTPWLIVAIALLWASYGMATVVVYTSAMQHVRQGKEGTDFTVQTVLTHLTGIVAAVFSGMVADRLGYTAMFSLQTLLALAALIYVVLAFGKRKTL